MLSDKFRSLQVFALTRRTTSFDEEYFHIKMTRRYLTKIWQEGFWSHP